MLQKVIGKTCRNPACALKDKLKEDFATMCECGHAREDVTATDKNKIVAFGGLIVIVLIGGVYLRVMKHKNDAVMDGLIHIVDVPEPLPPPSSLQNNSLPADSKAAMTLVSDGLNLVKEEKFQEAIDTFSMATSKDPNNDQTWGNLGAAYVATGKHHESLEPSRKAAALNPENAIWHLNLAEAYAVTGDKQKALDELDSAIKNGFTDKEKLKNFNFKNIQNDPRYREIAQKK